MATMQEEMHTDIRNGSDVINLVYSEATWRDLLIELVERNKLDPWNIDIVEIVDKYIDTVKGLRGALDLRIPANIILAAAILLRLKSNFLSLQDYGDNGEAPAEPAPSRPDIIVDPLSFRLRLPPRRKVSLTELLAALDEAMKIRDMHVNPAAKPLPAMPIKFDNFDIEAETEKLHGIIKANADKSRMVTFSYLSSLPSINDTLLELFIPLLFLAHKNKVMLMQERFFAEIIIALR